MAELRHSASLLPEPKCHGPPSVLACMRWEGARIHHSSSGLGADPPGSDLRAPILRAAAVVPSDTRAASMPLLSVTRCPALRAGTSGRGRLVAAPLGSGSGAWIRSTHLAILANSPTLFVRMFVFSLQDSAVHEVLREALRSGLCRFGFRGSCMRTPWPYSHHQMHRAASCRSWFWCLESPGTRALGSLAARFVLY